MFNATLIDDLTLNAAATFNQVTTDVQNDTWEERAAR
jgi:hypothetical protein